MTTPQDLTHEAIHPQQNAQSPRKVLPSVGAGNALEWYDWAVYATFAPFFATQIFNPDDPTSAILVTLAIFAVGFLARPFGGFVFGWIGDRLGRRLSMTLAVGLSAFGSLIVGLTPNFGAVGALASLIVLVARLLQGLGHGGELPSAQTYLSEVAPRERRGLWSSVIYVSGTLGVLTGTLMGAIFTSVLTKEQMLAFGWRIPFVVGGVLGIYALIMRARMPETEAFEGVRRTAAEAVAGDSVWTSIWKHRREALRIVGLTVGFTVIYYLWAINAPTYASTSLGMDPGHALWAGVIGQMIFIATLPFWGRLSDRIGRRPVLLIGALGAAVLHFPMTWFLDDSAWKLVVSMSIMLSLVGALAAVLPAAYAELFPANVRTVGTAVPYAMSVAIFGGTAPYLQSLFTNIVEMPWLFNLYAIALLLTTALVVWRLSETKGKDLSH